MRTLIHIVVAGALALLCAHVAAAEPLFTLSEDGTAFVYKARPGDQPGTVAAMFGIAPRDMAAFFAANGITDATRVGVGHVYRIPNPLAVRAAEAETKAAALVHDADEQRARADGLARDLATARAAAQEAEERAGRLARYERLWRLVSILGMVLVLATCVLGWLAFTAVRKTTAAETHARALATEIEEKRRTGLAERQQAAKRILDLETKVHELEVRAAAPASAARRPAGTG